METQREIQKNTTVYSFDTLHVDGKSEVQFKCLKRLVGERGFEPPTPWSNRESREERGGSDPETSSLELLCDAGLPSINLDYIT